jgi:hypothetical protein
MSAAATENDVLRHIPLRWPAPLRDPFGLAGGLSGGGRVVGAADRALERTWPCLTAGLAPSGRRGAVRLARRGA